MMTITMMSLHSLHLGSCKINYQQSIFTIMEEKLPKEIDLKNITFEDLKEEYKILALENDALRQLAESHKEEGERLSAENEKLKDTLKTKEHTLNYTWEQSDRLTKRIDELKGTLRSIIKLAESELK